MSNLQSRAPNAAISQVFCCSMWNVAGEPGQLAAPSSTAPAGELIHEAGTGGKSWRWTRPRTGFSVAPLQGVARHWSGHEEFSRHARLLPLHESPALGSEAMRDWGKLENAKLAQLP